MGLDEVVEDSIGDSSIVEVVRELGSGSEAIVYLELRNTFPLLDKTIRSKILFPVSHRIISSNKRVSEVSNINNTEFDLSDPSQAAVFNEFLRHVLAKKLDDYFLRKGKYRYPHIPLVLGLTPQGYFYEFVYGLEGYYPDYYDEDYNLIPVLLGEETIASNLFSSIGILLLHDMEEAGSSYLKNIIIQEPELESYPKEISNLWKRIDFGVSSLTFNYAKIKKYLEENKDDLNKVITKDRTEMLFLIIDYLIGSHKPNTFGDKRFNRMLDLITLFLQSTINQLGLGFISDEPIKVVPTWRIRRIKSQKSISLPEFSFNKKVYESDNSIIELSVLSSFPGPEGIIYTKKEAAISKIKYKIGHNNSNSSNNVDNILFKNFLKHFIIKKLDDYFVRKGYYHFSHIPMPFGCDGEYYYYEWVFGKSICNIELLEEAMKTKGKSGLPEYYEFITHFKRAGIDFESGTEVLEDKLRGKVAKQVVISQPVRLSEEPNSRMWYRVSFDDKNTIMDYRVLYNYLTENKKDLLKVLSRKRYSTMMLALDYLTGQVNGLKFKKLISGLHDFRVSTLKHLTPYAYLPIKRF